MESKKKLNEVLPIAPDLIKNLIPFCKKIEICGSIRRKRELVGDIEILCEPKKITVPVECQLSLFDSPRY